MALSPNEIMQLWTLKDQADRDGDHKRWLRDANSTSQEIRELSQAERVLDQAKQLAQKAIMERRG
jgi:cell division protein FtsL